RNPAQPGARRRDGPGTERGHDAECLRPRCPRLGFELCYRTGAERRACQARKRGDLLRRQSELPADLSHRWIDAAAGVRLHAVACGEGPLVVLLHGFPECWYSWRFIMPMLAAEGYRAIAVDLRGYNLS